jgi:transcriptional regulator GlxA family with amidase domain
MAKSASRARIAILTFHGCSAGVAAGMLEFFAAANVASRSDPRRSDREQRLECRVVAADSSSPVRASHGILLSPERHFRTCDAVVVPPIWGESRQVIADARRGLAETVDLLLEAARRPATIVASACSGAVLLAEAGLLAGRRATTCWRLADWLAHEYPEARINPEKLVEVDGRIWTAAAGTAYLHLCLDLVTRFCGAEVAMRAARLLLVEPRRGSQSPFLGFEAMETDRLDPVVARARRFMEDRLSQPLTIAQVCSGLGVSQRTLHRRFRDSQGVSPQAFLQALRISRAKALLQEATEPIDQLAEQCGYLDPASFRKLFARLVGLTPGEYRARFSPRRR